MRGPLLNALIWREPDDVIVALINNGADVNEQDSFGYTPLIIAVQQDRNAIISRLIRDGALLELQTQMHTTAIYYARNPSRRSTAELLLRAGAKWRYIATNWTTRIHLDSVGQRHEFVARIESRVGRCRSAVAALLRILWPKDVAKLVALTLWKTRVWDDWER